jgi:hypothetical protein
MATGTAELLAPRVARQARPAPASGRTREQLLMGFAKGILFSVGSPFSPFLRL